jgi:hypothetical protein
MALRRRSAGRAPAWQVEEDIAIVAAVTNLPGASVDGANMKAEDWALKVRTEFIRKAPVLPKERTWSERPAAACTKRWALIYRSCLKLESCMETVRAMELTGTPTDEELWRLGVGIYNGTVKPSHAYDVIRNPAYVVGDEFPFRDCHAWLKSHSDWLKPHDAYCNANGLTLETKRPNEPPPDVDVRSCFDDCMDSATDVVNADEDVVIPRSRPEGNKSAKKARRTSSTKQRPDENEIDNVGSALSAWTAAYQAVAERKHSLAEKLSNIERDVRERKSDLETFRVLFSESSGAPQEEATEYASLMREKMLLKIRGEVLMLKNATTTNDVERSLSDDGHLMSINCNYGSKPAAKGTSADIDLLSVRTGRPKRKIAEPAEKIEVLRNVFDFSSEKVDIDIEHDLEIAANRGPKTFTCAAGSLCAVSSASLPSANCQNEACNRDENGRGRLHDICAYRIWQKCGEIWPEPCSSNGVTGKICSINCHRETLRKADEDAN